MLKNLYQIRETMWGFGILGAGSVVPDFSLSLVHNGYQTHKLRPTGKLRHQNVASRTEDFPSQPSLRIPVLRMGPGERGNSRANRSPVHWDGRRRSLLQADSRRSILRGKCSSRVQSLQDCLCCLRGVGSAPMPGQHCPPGTATFQVRLPGTERQGTHI